MDIRVRELSRTHQLAARDSSMYCPKCSAQNEADQKYCRRCGLPLAMVQLATEGKMEEALATYKKAGETLSGSTIVLVICFLAALINLLLIPGPWGGYLILVNSTIGFLIALPMIIKGRMRLSHANRLLISDDPSRVVIDANQAGAELPPAAITDPLTPPVRVPGSIVDHTTLNLKSPGSR